MPSNQVATWRATESEKGLHLNGSKLGFFPDE